MHNRGIVVIICVIFLLVAISGFVNAVLKRNFLTATIALGFCAFCVAMIVWAIRFRRPSQEEFEKGTAAPLTLPDRDPIDLSAPNWLVSRFLIKKRSDGQLEFGTVAVDIDANRIHFQNCFDPEKKMFTGSVVAYNEVDLSEVLRVKVVRDWESPGRTMHIFTDHGEGWVPDHATNYESLLDLLTRTSRHLDKFDLTRKPWVESLLYGIAAVFIFYAIRWVLHLLV